MLNIDEEFEAAKAAKAAITTLLTTIPKSTVLSCGGALNEARGNVEIVMYGPPTLWKIEKAKVAVKEWLKRLASKELE